MPPVNRNRPIARFASIVCRPRVIQAFRDLVHWGHALRIKVRNARGRIIGEEYDLWEESYG